MKRIEDILAQCIEDIKAGKASLADCLDRYPSMRQQLEPLLRIALSIQEPPDVKPSNAFKIRTRVYLMEHIHAGRAAERTWGFGFWSNVRQVWNTVWLKRMAVVVPLMIVVLALVAGTAYAAQDSLPGDTLYPVKLGTEQIRRVLTIDDSAGTELELKFAGIRLKEIEAVADKRPDEIGVAIIGYERNLNMAIERAEHAKNSGVSASMMETVALAISGHLSILDGLEDSVPEPAKDAIWNAEEIAINGHVKTLRALARQKPGRAAEINLETMQGRLERAKAKSEKGAVKEAEIALKQFEELRRFGEEISEIAKGMGYDTRTVDELNARATAGQLEVLGFIYSHFPEGTKEAVERAMRVSIEGHGQAVKGLQQQGALDDIPEEPPLPDEIPDDVKGRILKPASKGPGNGQP